MHTRARTLFAALLGLSLASSQVDASAAGKTKRAASSAKAAAKGGEAKRHLDAGTRAFRAGKFVAALRELEEAQKMAPKASTLKMIAECHFKLNDYAAAYESYRDLTAAAGATKTEVSDAKHALKTLENLTGQIEISDNGTKVEVFIDGNSVGTTPIDLPVRTGIGAHKIRATLDGADVFETEVNVKPQETVPVPIDVVPKAKDAPAAAAASPNAKNGKVTINVTPAEAAIMIDGEEHGTGMFEGELPVGTHRVVALLAGYKNDWREITVTQDEMASESITLVPESDDKPGGAGKGLYLGASLFGAIPIVGATHIPTVDGGTAAFSFAMGGGVAVHGGYSFGLLSLEGRAAFLTDRHTEQHGVPGSTDPESVEFQQGGSAHTESYLIYSLGGFAGVGPRITTPGHAIRLTAALTPGFSIRQFTLQRDVGIGTVDKFTATASRASFALTGDASVLIGISSSLSLSVGVFAWVDLGGDTSTPSRDPYTVVVPSGDHTVDALVPTPAYTVQRGAEIFIGPQVGLRFGP